MEKQILLLAGGSRKDILQKGIHIGWVNLQSSTFYYTYRSVSRFLHLFFTHTEMTILIVKKNEALLYVLTWKVFQDVLSKNIKQKPCAEHNTIPFGCVGGSCMYFVIYMCVYVCLQIFATYLNINYILEM